MVAVAQLVECPFKCPSKRCGSLTDAGSNPGGDIRWEGKIMAAPSMGEHLNNNAVWEIERKKICVEENFS